MKNITRIAVIAALAACAGENQPEPGADSAQPAAAESAAIEIVAQPQDSVIVEQRLKWALEQKLDTLPIGESAARIGRTFVGSPYTPGTLEVPGPERLVINLREFDCVTFVESSLALARAARAKRTDFAAFKEELARIRYRDGALAGYPSRLHYFSEWIANNETKGVVRNITPEVGGELDPEPINFMTGHVSAYRQLSDPAIVEQIRAMEARLTGVPRYVVPENAIGKAAAEIKNGDVIAAASTLPGLDIAHTGLALWVDGKLHLMHAPLVGSVVEISQVPLADRIIRQDKQDGIMVARPL